MTLYVHRAERTDLLADDLGALLSAPLPDPLAQEVVVVPARGVERWLTQRLSHRLGVPAQPSGAASPVGGVCAGVRFLTPLSLVALLTGRDRDDPWNPDRLAWAVLQVLDEHLDEAWCAGLAAHLGHGRDPDEVRAGRRYSVARRLAGLFASYAAQRPDLLRDWREHRAGDGAGGVLDSDLDWQPHLWRHVLERVDADPPDVRHADTLARLREGDPTLELPDRLSLFGHTRLPVTEIEVLAALGARRDVHLWLPQVSTRVWDDLAELCAAGPVPRTEDRSGDRVGHPLLASLGRDARELQRALAVAGRLATVHTPPGRAASGARDTVLGWLQADLRSGVAPAPDARAARLTDRSDRSVQIHACHGPARQVEVLREVLVGLLADDPTLEPRDIIVMCPDIEAYAPLVQAGFGLGESGLAGEPGGTPGRGGSTGLGRRASAARHPGHRLRVRLADRAVTATNPVAAVASSLLALVGGRMTASEVLDLAGAAPVRRRFGFDDDDLDQVARWVEQAAIRWGLDAAARSPYDLARFGQNTWRFGLDRILLGAATPETVGGDENEIEDEHEDVAGQEPMRTPGLGAALPVDDVAGGDIDLAGRLAELVDRIGRCLVRLDAAHTAQEWMDALGAGVRSVTDVALAEAWQPAQLERELAAVVEASAPDTRLRLADVRGLLAHRFGALPTRANFRTGTLTVATMVPMRSVPHRVVALLGLDDGVFPRTNAVDGDDVLARAPRTGERDPRSEDRQLLLDAIMAATDHLVVTYAGAGEHTGRPRPPAVPLGELIDAVAETVAPGSPSPVVRHPLQPFDARNFAAEGLGGAGPFSFDSAALAGARAASSPRTPRPPLLSAPLLRPPGNDVDLADLLAFFAHPARHFLRSRLDVAAPLEGDEPLDAMPVALDALERWGVGDRLLTDALRGVPPRTGLTAERLRGLLPPGTLADAVLREVGTVVDALARAAARLRAEPVRSVDVDVDLGGGRRLTGTVTGVHGDRHVAAGYSSMSPKRRLESWITLLALVSADPARPWSAHVVGRRGSRALTAAAGPIAVADARRWLADLVEVYDRGACEPVPLPSRTAFAYAEAFLRATAGEDVDVVAAADREWSGTPDRAGAPPGEALDAWNARVHGPGAPLSMLLDAPDEAWNGAPDRLGQYAVRVWEPVLRGGQVLG